ncbi:tartrate dehydrogenase/decarboxylase / D-malate dehydrogenase [Bhargavaea beijingensis]|uniref:D-malate dehydrogenase (decarboxylating) n=1 Tax=Bhargavaea beijingensis TaxID=426756 RepID=A0A1G6YV13_9BACL|nr:tartrate dehydrogenase [Bhargavaea beijingensis]SDD93477.1 tartrate dehydrogenase/decarboxylase / D-malate dehydrogenase [Bhargavaea beijingensis]
MADYRIAVIAGDGIGPEVMDEALKVLCEAEQEEGFSLEIQAFPWNSEYYLEHGRMMPEDGLDTLQTFDAILFGAIGDARVPDEVTIWELIMPIRKGFRQYVNFRPVKSLPGIPSLLANGEDIDFVIFRENAEGEYSDSGGRLYAGQEGEIAIQNTIMTRTGVERITRAACRYAEEHGLGKVTSATKSNAVIHANKLWDEHVRRIVEEEFGGLQFEQYYVDALAAYFVQRPQSFDVVLASNLFGDILSDLGSGLVGGLGLSPSGNINPEKDYPSMFEPVHGSAPDIAGQGIANPIAQIWSAALMLEHLGEKRAAGRIVKAIEDVLAEGKVKTRDIGGTATTREMGSAIGEAFKNQTTKATEG